MIKDVSPLNLKRRENLRFKTELDWLDKKFFIPVDFDIVEEDEKNPDLKNIAVQRQYGYISYNYDIIEMLQDFDKQHGISIFKYITYQQMADVYVNGDMKKEDIKAQLIFENEGYANSLQFGTYADKFKEYRNVVVDELSKDEYIQVMIDELGKEETKKPQSVLKERMHELSEEEVKRREKEWTDLYNRVHGDDDEDW